MTVSLMHLDLFSGIGGFALAAQWAGFQTVAFCEIEPYCQKVLRKNFGQGIVIHDDIRKLDGKPYAGTIDLLTGGFPCQPFSIAGKRRGNADDRSLWHEMFRLVQECKPAWVVGENVAHFVNMELDNVRADLEGEGYEVQPFVIPAASVGAPHKRDRCFIVAHSQHRRPQDRRRKGIGQNVYTRDENQRPTSPEFCRGPDVPDSPRGQDNERKHRDLAEAQGRGQSRNNAAGIGSPDVSDAQSRTGQLFAGEREDLRDQFTVDGAARPSYDGSNSPVSGLPKWRGPSLAESGQDTQPYRRDSIFTELQDDAGRCTYARWWAVEPSMGRVANGVSHRVDRLRGLGNAVVPQQVYPILKAIAESQLQRVKP